MKNYFSEQDYQWIKELLEYPEKLKEYLASIKDTSEVKIPDDPIEKVIFQDRAKNAIRKIAQNKGHILMIGRPGTGKSMLANLFKEVIDKTFGEYIRPKDAIIAYPGKDNNHIRIAYEKPEIIDEHIAKMRKSIEEASNNMASFSLADQINVMKKVRNGLIIGAVLTCIIGFFFPMVFAGTGLAVMGAIFMFIQENNLKAQEKIQQDAYGKKKFEAKRLYDNIPEILYDPRKDLELMARVSEPNSRNMKGGFRHDPYQSGNLQTPAHKRAYLGVHAKSPIIFIDELKSLIKASYMSSLLEIMQNKDYLLEGGTQTGSGSADRAENKLKANNIFIACSNHDTLQYLRDEGDGAFLSRIEDKGEIILMESAIPESQEAINQIAQYIKQEVINLQKEFDETWGEILESEGMEGVRKRCEHIYGRNLTPAFKMEARDFSQSAILEIVKELRCRSSNKKLSCILRPLNGVIKSAEYIAILDNAHLVEDRHVGKALTDHLSLEGGMTKDIIENRKSLKKYLSSLTDAIGYVIGLAVIEARAGGQMYGQPLPIRCQINTGGVDTVIASGKIGDIAKAACQNVRASIKRVFNKIGISYSGYEMHVEYIQAHGGVEGDSASVAMDVALISDYISIPVNQKYGITGSLTGDIVLAVGGVTEKVRSIMDIDLGMNGACIPWQNKYDIEPLLINTEFEYIQNDEIPGIRIYRQENRQAPFDIYFCKSKYNAYKILMNISKDDLENLMIERSKKDREMVNNIRKVS